MFDVANDRLNYSEVLEPNPGYELDFAVGLTYSLDLEALLGVPVALGLLGDNDDELMKSPFYTLEAIRKSSDKLAIFCNGGNISMPQKIMSVYALLEKSVFQVKLPNKQNFHPKLWFIKYTNDLGESYIKLVVLTRNLTFDKSIDLCVEMQGEIGESSSDRNKPLSDMLKYVAEDTDKKCSDKKEKILSLAEDILKVKEFSTMEPFESYEFLPLGFDGYDKDSTGLFGGKNDVLIVSPFLSDSIIHEISKSAYRRALITRKGSITSSILESFSGKYGEGIYITKEVLNDNEYGMNQDIHAKLYHTTTDEGNYLYIGSANASYNAFHNNIEFLLKLKIKSRGMGFKTIFDEWLPKENCPFEKVQVMPEQSETDEDQRLVDEALKEAVHALKSAKVSETDGVYQVTVSAKRIKSTETIIIAPLYRQDLATAIEEKTTFSNLLLKELSEFYVLSVGNKKVIVKIETRGIPTSLRDDGIYKSIIDTKSKFLTYISFMLSEDYAGAISEIESLDVSSNISDDQANLQAYNYSGLYEKMLKIAHQNPDRLEEINDLIKRLDDNVISEDFMAMYKKFSLALRRVERWVMLWCPKIFKKLLLIA